MKSLLVGYSLFIACCIGVMAQRLPDLKPSGRRGDVLSLGDISEQTVFNVDNSGGSSGGNPGGKGGRTPTSDPMDQPDCAVVNQMCKCGSVPPPGPNPTGQYQMDYDSY